MCVWGVEVCVGVSVGRRSVCVRGKGVCGGVWEGCVGGVCRCGEGVLVWERKVWEDVCVCV